MDVKCPTGWIASWSLGRLVSMMQKSEQKQLIISVRTKNIRHNNQSLAGVKFRIDEIKRSVCTTYSYSSNEIIVISWKSPWGGGCDATISQPPAFPCPAHSDSWLNNQNFPGNRQITHLLTIQVCRNILYIKCIIIIINQGIYGEIG